MIVKITQAFRRRMMFWYYVAVSLFLLFASGCGLLVHDDWPGPARLTVYIFALFMEALLVFNLASGDVKRYEEELSQVRDSDEDWKIRLPFSWRTITKE